MANRSFGMSSRKAFQEKEIHKDDDNNTEKKLKEKMNRLINVYADRISLAGLHEARTAPKGSIQVFWIFSLLICHICLIYLTADAVSHFVRNSSKTKTHVEDKIVQSLTFPNVTVCAPFQIDTKRADTEFVVIPKNAEKYIAKRFPTRKDLIETLLVYNAMSTNEKPHLDERDYRYLDRIYVASMIGNRSINLLLDQFFNCSQTIENCKFDGRPYDCCRDAVTIYTDDVKCFTLQTYQKMQSVQMEPSLRSGLEVEISTNWRYVPPTYNDMTDGYLVQVGNVYTNLADAVGVPTGMEISVRIVPTKSVQKGKCLPDGSAIPRLKYFPYYDPHGYNCLAEGFLDDLIFQFVNCLIPYASFVPNDTICCTSQAGRVLHDALFGKYDSMASNAGWLRVRQHLRNMFYSGKCLPMCTTWNYDTHIGYSTILPDPRTKDPYYSRSRIKVFFADFKYVQVEETAAFTYHMLFSKIGALAALYAGLSVIGVFELSGYGVVIARYWISYKVKTRKPKIMQNKVHPLTGFHSKGKVERITIVQSGSSKL